MTTATMPMAEIFMAIENKRAQIQREIEAFRLDKEREFREFERRLRGLSDGEADEKMLRDISSIHESLTSAHPGESDMDVLETDNRMRAGETVPACEHAQRPVLAGEPVAKGDGKWEGLFTPGFLALIDTRPAIEMAKPSVSIATTSTSLSIDLLPSKSTSPSSSSLKPEASLETEINPSLSALTIGSKDLKSGAVSSPALRSSLRNPRHTHSPKRVLFSTEDGKFVSTSTSPTIPILQNWNEPLNPNTTYDTRINDRSRSSSRHRVKKPRRKARSTIQQHPQPQSDWAPTPTPTPRSIETDRMDACTETLQFGHASSATGPTSGWQKNRPLSTSLSPAKLPMLDAAFPSSLMSCSLDRLQNARIYPGDFDSETSTGPAADPVGEDGESPDQSVDEAGLFSFDEDLEPSSHATTTFMLNDGSKLQDRGSEQSYMTYLGFEGDEEAYGCISSSTSGSTVGSNSMAIPMGVGMAMGNATGSPASRRDISEAREDVARSNRSETMMVGG